MFPYSTSVTPAVRSHLEAQTAYFNELSRSIASSFQNLSTANLQLGQTMFEESVQAGQRMLGAHHPGEVLAALSASAEPAAGKLRAYQQHVSCLAADAQVALSRVTEQHIPHTSRTAQSLAEQVGRVAEEESARRLNQQEEALKQFTDPFTQDGARRANGAARPQGAPQGRHESAAGNMQSDTQPAAPGEQDKAQQSQAGQQHAGKGEHKQNR